METHTKNYGSVIEGPIKTFTSFYQPAIGKKLDRSGGVYEFKFDDIKLIKSRNCHRMKTSDICRNINKVIFVKNKYYPGTNFQPTKESFTLDRWIIHIMIKYSMPISSYSSQTDYMEIKFIDNHGSIYSEVYSMTNYECHPDSYNCHSEHPLRLGALKVNIHNNHIKINTISKDTDPLPNKIIDFIKKYSSFDIPDYSTNSEFYKDLIGITKEIPCGDLLSLEDDEIPEKETPSGDLLSLEDD